MPISRAPYLEYNEESSIGNYNIENFNIDIPVILAPTNVMMPIYDEDGNIVSDINGVRYEEKVAENNINNLLMFNSYDKAKKRIVDEDVLKFIKQFLDENNTHSNSAVPHIYVMPIPCTEKKTKTETVDGREVETVTFDKITVSPTSYENAYKVISKVKEITCVICFGVNGTDDALKGFGGSFANLLATDVKKGNLKIAYCNAPRRQENETILNYATRIANINKQINSSRFALVEPDNYGTLMARICTTPYFIEPGYLPIGSLSTGVFEALNDEERDALCMCGLIFGEDDELLPTVIPRICLATSSAFGRTYSGTDDGYGDRYVDSLIHVRRNVDHHVRNILRTLAYQLKRNETSVNLDYCKMEIMTYLEQELRNGNIQGYSFSLDEASYNPYCLEVNGEIIPVNATLAIKFNNVIRAPYAIASNYI